MRALIPGDSWLPNSSKGWQPFCKFRFCLVLDSAERVMCFDHHHHHFIENRKVLLALFVESTVWKKTSTVLKIGSHSGVHWQALANTIMTVLRGCHHDLLWFCNNAFKGC